MHDWECLKSFCLIAKEQGKITKMSFLCLIFLITITWTIIISNLVIKKLKIFTNK